MLLHLHQGGALVAGAPAGGWKPLKGCLVPSCPVRSDSPLFSARHRLCSEHQRNLAVRGRVDAVSDVGQRQGGVSAADVGNRRVAPERTFSRLASATAG